MSGVAWAHAGPTVLAAFFASLVEFVEALTVVLAVGGVRGWRDALGGAAAATLVLVLAVGAFGSAIERLPLAALRPIVGALLLLFGLRWLRKAVLRSAGLVPRRDEAAAFDRQARAMRGRRAARGWDAVAFGTTFQVTLLEGAEVAFIVLAGAAGDRGLLAPASVAAGAALLVVTGLGVLLRRPLLRVPENALKFAAGVLLSAFGAFWAGEGAGIAWPGGDLAMPGLVACTLLLALLAVAVCRRTAGAAGDAPRRR